MLACSLPYEKGTAICCAKKQKNTIFEWFRKLTVGLGNFSFDFDLFVILVLLIKIDMNRESARILKAYFPLLYCKANVERSEADGSMEYENREKRHLDV